MKSKRFTWAVWSWFLWPLLAAASPIAVDRDVPAVMRDGTVLRADVYRPSTGGPYPVLLMRTPYNKSKQHLERYANGGYIVVCQDVRGRFASDGVWESWLRPKTHDAEDGYDSVQWASKLPNANGKVGTFGISYSAFLQWRLAPLHPAALVAMSAHSIPAHYVDLEEPGTIRPGRRLYWSMVTMAPEMRRRANRPPPHTDTEAAKIWDSGGSAKWLNFLPWLNLPDEIFDHETEYLRAWLRQPEMDPWMLDVGCANIAVPNLDVAGWYDHAKGDMVMEETLIRNGLTINARAGSRMILGPWSHFPPGGRRFGPIDFGPAADVDLVALDLQWFDHWLKGVSNEFVNSLPVTIFVMGDNTWRGEDQWPPAESRPRILYFDSGGKANTPAGDGKLIDEAPSQAGNDNYDYNPGDPAPTLFAHANFTCATDQRPLSGRRDILVYQTGPLRNRVEVTGFPEVELYAASSAPDTDWVARLVDVAPDGLARDVCEGVLRARYRNGLHHPELIEPGKTVCYRIRLHPTANAFLAGHRIRLDITSSDFPNYDRNHNTAADPNADSTLAVAHQTVYHGGASASKIILPWIPNDTKRTAVMDMPLNP